MSDVPTNSNYATECCDPLGIQCTCAKEEDRMSPEDREDLCTCTAGSLPATKHSPRCPVATGRVKLGEARRLLAEGLHFCVNGERAPGGNETWAEWAQKAEMWLRRDMCRRYGHDYPPVSPNGPGNNGACRTCGSIYVIRRTPQDRLCEDCARDGESYCLCPDAVPVADPVCRLPAGDGSGASLCVRRSGHGGPGIFCTSNALRAAQRDQQYFGEDGN